MVKKLLLFAFVFVLTLTKAQTQLTKPTEDFNEEQAYKDARKKGIPETDITGYVRALKAKHVGASHPHTEAEYFKKVTTINMNTRQVTQSVQSSLCGNSDLALLNYSNWNGDISDNNSVGPVYPINSYSATGINGNFGSPVLLNTDPCNGTNIATDRQVIMTTPPGALTNNISNAFTNGYDPSCQNPVTGNFDLSVCPTAGTNSIRMGSAYPNYTGEKLSYQISVNNSNSLFTYRFALVITRNSTHGVGEQAAFTFQLKDSVGNAIGGLCGAYDIDAQGAATDTTYINSTSSCFNAGVPDCYYRKWHTVTLDLSAYIGQTVTADFETMDCIYGGHYCYAYISANCGALTANIAGFCGNTGSAIMFAPAGFASYQWSGPNTYTAIPGATASSYTATSAVPGDTYTVDCVTLQGCTTKLTLAVTNSNISASTSSTPSCKGGATGSASVSVLGGTMFSYNWQPAGGTNASTPNSLAPGTYSVTIHDNTGHCPDSTVTAIVNAAPPPLTTTSSQLCGTALSPALTVPSGGQAPYSWTMNTSTVVIGTSATLSYTPAVAPSDYFIVTYKDPVTGCEDSLKTTLNQVTIDFAAAPSPACHGGNNGSVVLNPIGTNTYTAFDWTLNGSPVHPNGTPNGSGPVIYDSLLAGGTYTFVINPTGNNTCTFSLTANVSQGGLTIPPPVTVKGCLLDTIHVVPAVAPGSTHHWYHGTSPLPAPNFSASPLDLSGSLNANGLTYTDTVYSAAPNFCVSVYKVTIKTQNFTGNINVVEAIKCHNDSTGKIKVNVTSETNGPLGHQYSMTWTYPAPYTSPATIYGGTTAPQSSTENALHAGIYSVTVKSGNCVNTYTTNLTNPAPLNDDTLNLFYCPKDDSALICATEAGHSKYTWLLNGVVVPGLINDSIWVRTGDVNNYIAAYLDNGCKDTANILVTFPSWHAFRPDTFVNVFTPNGDKLNDVYYPFYKRYVTVEEIARQTYYYEIHIYNRWGQLVFEAEDYKLGWTGIEHNGNPADDGTYFYILKYKSNCGTKADLVTHKGFVQLLR